MRRGESRGCWQSWQSWQNELGPRMAFLRAASEAPWNTTNKQTNKQTYAHTIHIRNQPFFPEAQRGNARLGKKEREDRKVSDGSLDHLCFPRIQDIPSSRIVLLNTSSPSKLVFFSTFLCRLWMCIAKRDSCPRTTLHQREPCLLQRQHLWLGHQCKLSFSMRLNDQSETS